MNSYLLSFLLLVLLVAPIIKSEKKEKHLWFACNLSSALSLATPIEKANVRGALSIRLDVLFCRSKGLVPSTVSRYYLYAIQSNKKRKKNSCYFYAAYLLHCYLQLQQYRKPMPGCWCHCRWVLSGLCWEGPNICWRVLALFLPLRELVCLVCLYPSGHSLCNKTLCRIVHVFLLYIGLYRGIGGVLDAWKLIFHVWRNQKNHPVSDFLIVISFHNASKIIVLSNNNNLVKNTNNNQSHYCT